MQSDGIKAKGIDLSLVMVEACKQNGLDAVHTDLSGVDGSFDAIVSIFDVLNFLDKDSLENFLDLIASRLNDNGVFIADINTLYGFSDVAEGTMSNENEDEFLIVDAVFENNELHTKFTLFQKDRDRYTKYQDTIVQYFHKISFFQNHKKLKLIDKQTFSLYDTNDKTLLIFKKR